MTLTTVFHHASRSLLLAAVLLAPPAAYPQTTLTGAIGFASNSSGAYTNYAEWNTLGGDIINDLWLALNSDATSPVNGPTDADAGITIPLQADNSYRYYIFTGGPCCAFSVASLNLFFDGNSSTPGISVLGAVNSPNFRPNSSGSTLTLEGAPVAGSGTTSYSSNGVIVLLTGYEMNTPATPPGDVCQNFAFSPGDALSFFGSITLNVYSAASMSLNQASGPPGSKLTLTGGGFAPTEAVDIYAGRIGTTPLSTAATDASGAFTATLREPQLPYGPIDFYAVGLTSGKLGVASFSVIPTLATNPGTAAPDGTTTAYVFGFGAGETVDVYWNEPRQLLGTAAANGLGSGTLTITIPENASPGTNGVIGVGQTTKAIGIGKVTVE